MIIVENLCFSYNGQKVFHNLNFKIMDGQWISLMGDNGSGKTTLVNILVGLLPFLKGNIWLNGLQMNLLNNQSLRDMIGIIFQNPDYQFVGFDVCSDIAFGLENQRLSRTIIQQKIKKYACMLNIEHLLDKKQQELSGGQKQKVAIASVLAMEPQIIIFDESTAFLDPKSKQEIYQIIQQIHQNKKQILITITHDLVFALKSDEIMFLNQQGELWKKDRPINLLRDNDFVNKYFDNLPLNLKIYYQLEKEKLNLNNSKHYGDLRSLLWQYNLIM